MPRVNRRRDDAPSFDHHRARGAQVGTEQHPDGRWFVRHVRPRREGRTYVCPGCQHAVGDDVAHVVAWPAEGMGDVSDRRHWHTTCWTARNRRHPRGAVR